jgi:hypothetical protein
VALKGRLERLRSARLSVPVRTAAEQWSSFRRRRSPPTRLLTSPSFPAPPAALFTSHHCHHYYNVRSPNEMKDKRKEKERIINSNANSS